MGADTNIAWCDATINGAFGCFMVDTEPEFGACYKCYWFEWARKMKKDPEQISYFDMKRKSHELTVSKKWEGKERIFFGSMTDTFGEFHTFETIEGWHKDLIEVHPERIFIIPTKRIGRAMVFYRRKGYIPKNVWLLTSIGARNRLRRLDILRQLKSMGAVVVGVSVEPLLQDLGEFSLAGIDWVICGGESDDKAPRPMQPEWAENVRRISERDKVPFFFKQMGGKGGDGAGGDLLNGVRYHNFPSGTCHCPACAVWNGRQYVLRPTLA